MNEQTILSKLSEKDKKNFYYFKNTENITAMKKISDDFDAKIYQQATENNAMYFAARSSARGADKLTLLFAAPGIPLWKYEVTFNPGYIKPFLFYPTNDRTRGIEFSTLSEVLGYLPLYVLQHDKDYKAIAPEVRNAGIKEFDVKAYNINQVNTYLNNLSVTQFAPRTGQPNIEENINEKIEQFCNLALKSLK